MYIKGFSIYSKINPPKKYEKPQISLHYLAELSANNYTIVINPNVPDPFRNKIMTFDGYAYKKRSRNTFTVVDSWSHIKNEHWKMFRKQSTLPLNRDSWAEIFINEPMYFAICRVQQRGFNNIKEFVITYNENDLDINFIKGFTPIKMGFSIKFISKKNV